MMRLFLRAFAHLGCACRGLGGVDIVFLCVYALCCAGPLSEYCSAALGAMAECYVF